MRIVFIFLTLVSFVFAQNPQKTDTKNTPTKQDTKLSKEEQAKRDALIKQMQEKAKLEMERQKQEAELAKQKAIKEEQEAKKRASYRQAREELESIDKEIENNIWMKRYNNYITFNEVSKELKDLKTKAKKYSRWKEEKWRKLSSELKKKAQIKENEVKLLQEYEISPIGNYITPPKIDDIPKVTNPFVIIEAMSFKKKIEESNNHYKAILDEVADLLMLLENKKEILTTITKLTENKTYEDKLKDLKVTINDISNTLETISSTYNVYSRRVEQIVLETNQNIKNQINKSVKLAFFIFILFFLSFLIKLGLKKYYSENESYFVTTKVVNFIMFIIIANILLFAYIDNVDYLVTILGFASAGIAIALKDWFMSIFGWLVIVSSGMINIGDRIKVQRSGIEVVGDVLDISMFRITVREDITLTSYTTNRRTGRIYFIPNNYIFTDMIANYSHAGLRTVWDGIDFNITFESNHKKAQNICKEILKQYSKGYSDMTRRRLTKLKDKYDLRITYVEPRVFTFVEPYGIRVSNWYMTNAFATLTLRSTISMEILDAFAKEDDIILAYPTQTIDVDKTALNDAPDLPSNVSQPSLF
jgi:small-conductance mechanosensitive channel